MAKYRKYTNLGGGKEYTQQDMPANRVALFFNVLMVRIWKMIQLNLLIIVPLLPAIVWSFVSLILFGTLFNGEDAMGVIQSLNRLQLNTLLNDMYTVGFFYTLGMIPALTLAGAPLAGMMRVLRNWARDEHAWVWADFTKGMKQNWKHATLVMFINSLVLFAGFNALFFYSEMAKTMGWFYQVAQIMFYVMITVWAMINVYLIPLMVQFKLSFKQLYNNAILITFARLPYSILFLILLLLPVLLIYVHLTVFILYYLLIGFAFAGLIQASYCNATFDRLILSQMTGVEINRGLRKDDDDEDEDLAAKGWLSKILYRKK